MAGNTFNPDNVWGADNSKINDGVSTGTLFWDTSPSNHCHYCSLIHSSVVTNGMHGCGNPYCPGQSWFRKNLTPKVSELEWAWESILYLKGRPELEAAVMKSNRNPFQVFMENFPEVNNEKVR